MDDQLSCLNKRLKVGTAGTLLQLKQRKAKEASLFASEMFKGNSTKKLAAAKSTFNHSSAAALDRSVRQAQVQVPPIPDTDDPTDLKNHIKIVTAVNETQKEVSVYS